MNILFIAARQHTNYNGVFKALIKKNNIFFNSIYRSRIEDYSFVKPDILKQSLITKLILIFLGKDKIKFFYFPKFFEYYKYLKRVKPDLVILRITGRFNLYLNLIFLSFFSCKILCHEQKISSRRTLKKTSIKNFLLYLEWFLLKFTFNIRFFSPIYKKVDKDFFYLPFVTDFKKKKFLKNKKTNFVTIGKFEKRKNYIFLLSALKKLKTNFSLLIIGEKTKNTHSLNLKNIKNYIKVNGLQDKVKIKVNVPHKKINNFLKNRGLFILPSYNEPASISILESISFGVPVICSDTCGTKVYVKESINGFIFKTNNENSLLNKINFYLNSKKKFEQYSKNCLQYSSSELSSFNFNLYFNKILNSFKK